MEENEEQNKKKSRGRKMVRKGSRKITKKPSRIDDEGGLSQHQIDTMEEFMKYREGETEAQWKKRTRFRRPRTKEDIENNTYLIRKDKTLGKKLRVKKTNIKKYNNHHSVKVIVSERKYSDLKFLGIVKRYYSVKHGISIEDFDLAFYFYENIPFTKIEFNTVVRLYYGRLFGEFKRFDDNGYINNIVRTKRFLKKEDEIRVSDKYLLSSQMVQIVSGIYKTLMEFREIQNNSTEEVMIPYGIQTMINKYNRGIKEILTGKTSVDRIIKVTD